VAAIERRIRRAVRRGDAQLAASSRKILKKGDFYVQSKLSKISFWIVTGLFRLWMTFTAFAQLKLPQVAEAFRQLGFPGYFRFLFSQEGCFLWDGKLCRYVIVFV
jgi:hypothetical protein